VARQAIPRVDLYEELGVEPSADDDAIEAAYQSLTWRHDPDVTGINEDARLVRLRLAHEWLTDTERRSRYDASRSRAKARASAKPRTAKPAATKKPRKPATRRTKAAAATAAAGTAVAAGLTADEAATAALPGLTAEEAAAAEAAAAAEVMAPPTPRELGGAWPATDLVRTTRAETLPLRPSRRTVVGVAGLAAIAIPAVVAIVALSLPPSAPVAVASASPPPATPTAIAETASPQPEPTLAVTAPPVTALPIDLVVMQQSAWETIQALKAAADAGDVTTAQTMLGDTAPGLRASGLRRATFPDVVAGDISAESDGTRFVATTADGGRLTSPDGKRWTFDYADRPLAYYPAPIGGSPRELYWIENDGRHDIFLRLNWVTVSNGGVAAKVSWSIDPSDTTYFGRSAVMISSLTLGSTETTVTTTPLAMVGATTSTLTGKFDGAGSVPDSLVIGITVTNPRAADGSDRPVESTWEVVVR
jgi:DnaJ domain